MECTYQMQPQSHTNPLPTVSINCQYQMCIWNVNDKLNIKRAYQSCASTVHIKYNINCAYQMRASNVISNPTSNVNIKHPHEMHISNATAIVQRKVFRALHAGTTAHTVRAADSTHGQDGFGKHVAIVTKTITTARWD